MYTFTLCFQRAGVSFVAPVFLDHARHFMLALVLSAGKLQAKYLADIFICTEGEEGREGGGRKGSCVFTSSVVQWPHSQGEGFSSLSQY